MGCAVGGRSRAHELDPATKPYALAGVFHDRLKVSVPYGIDIDPTAIDRRPGA